jgi:signal transduction histidine kinase
LAFFGKVSSVACHELKNVLAIINENYGLLDDMVFMAQKGRAIEPERLSRVCEGVAKQIRRADELLQHVSRFAHSVDQFEGEIDLEDCCRLVVFLARRLTAARKLTVEVEAADGGAARLASGNPFLVENLIWTALLDAVQFCENGGVIRLVPGQRDGQPMVAFCGLNRLNDDFCPVSSLTVLLASMSARWEIHCPEQRCELIFTECEG